jgi:hypothetical protein
MLVPACFARAETFYLRYQADMRHGHLCLIAQSCNFKYHGGSVPLCFVLQPWQMAVCNQPCDFFTGNAFGNFKGYKCFAEMDGKNVI